MLSKLYYVVKPVLPWRVRLALRRIRAARRRHRFADVWPISERAGVTPPGWPGWPDGKRFAVVLTHDVEGTKGLNRVEQLMRLEQRYGFFSSFNFVPEGEYRVPESLRRTLDTNGWEVGIHGLEHDGKLYASQAKFAEKAMRIREYLNSWNAVGFRSPLMQHKLGWLQALAAEYDSSTFDTDPFEPQPDGVDTVFPFWVRGKGEGGYVELPYTLVQDFTLFTVLREQNIDIWKRKIDWLAERGGMVLLNTHPDYMCFNGTPGRDEYPVSRYEELFQYLREKYDGAFWSARPRDVSRHYCASLPANSRNTRKKICMLAYTCYEADNRVRRYAETLARRGDQVDVIALTGASSLKPVEEIQGVTVYRIQHREFNEPHKWSYAWRLLRFLQRSSIFMTRLHHQKRYDLIHIHNMPDFLVFAAWYPKLTGARLVLDIHDVVPELFANKFRAKLAGGYVKALKLIEKLSAAFVDHVIVANHLWQNTLLERSVPAEKCSVFLNHVDPAIFYQRARTRDDGKFIVIFPGSLQWHQGLDIAIEAFARFKQEVPSAEFHIYGGGGGDRKDELKDLAQNFGLSDSVKFFEGVSLDRIPEVIANADLGVVPKRADSFGNEAYSTKIMEFMSQGVPVVASRTKIDSFYFNEGLVHFFNSGDKEALAQAMLDVVRDRELREMLVARGFEYAARNSWDEKKQGYLDLVDSLTTEDFESAGTMPAVSSAGKEFVLGTSTSSHAMASDAHASLPSTDKPARLESLGARAAHPTQQ